MSSNQPVISQPKIGFFSIGLEAYWAQFEGLRERLVGYNQVIADQLASAGAQVINLGMVDNTEKAVEAGHAFRQSSIDLLFLHASTYALSSTVLPVVRRARVPVIILNLAPGDCIDYASFNAMGDRRAMTGEWLAWCGTCPVPEIANVFKRCRIPFYQITGILQNDQEAGREIQEWVQAASVASIMEHNRLGLMGHYYGGMLDIYTDLTLQSATFGGHMQLIEVEELASLIENTHHEEVEDRMALLANTFDIQPDCSAEELQRSARTSVALDKLAARHSLGSLAYFHQGTGNPSNENAISSIILGTCLLTANGIPVAGEYEVKNVLAMKIMQAFHAGGSFSEFYAMDFKDDVVLFGHDGPGHPAIAEGKVKVKPLAVYHGKVGRGLSVEMSVKHGPVTLLSVAESSDGRMKFVVAQAESVSGPILEIGNTNSRYKFALSARQFVASWSSQGPAHHCAIGVGHIASKVQKLADLLNIEMVRVC